jgi:hypothetical protein
MAEEVLLGLATFASGQTNPSLYLLSGLATRAMCAIRDRVEAPQGTVSLFAAVDWTPRPSFSCGSSRRAWGNVSEHNLGAT